MLKFLIVVVMVCFCKSQTTVAQVPEKTEKEVPPPPPPPPPEPEVEEIFKVIEDMPRFIGCEDELTNEEKKECAEEKMYEHIYSNLKYPELAREHGVEGTVVVRFYVDKDGTIKAPELLKDIGAGCGKEALRLVRSMHQAEIAKWTPGKSRGKAVKVYFNLPIKFELNKTENKEE